MYKKYANLFGGLISSSTYVPRGKKYLYLALPAAAAVLMKTKVVAAVDTYLPIYMLCAIDTTGTEVHYCFLCSGTGVETLK